jgi:hypothetical protein
MWPRSRSSPPDAVTDAANDRSETLFMHVRGIGGKWSDLDCPTAGADNCGTLAAGPMPHSPAVPAMLGSPAAGPDVLFARDGVVPAAGAVLRRHAHLGAPCVESAQHGIARVHAGMIDSAQRPEKYLIVADLAMGWDGEVQR